MGGEERRSKRIEREKLIKQENNKGNTLQTYFKYDAY